MGTARYGSDVAVDALHALGVRYLALNPGASFRGFHDSLVNYGGNRPEVIVVPHEKVAVGIAHGYAKASGEPMGVVTHDLVGLLQASMGVFYAYVDRVPMLVLGGAGPMDQAKRRPWIDWVHTANVQNTSVRDFTKWDDHAYSAEAIPESFARAWRVATMQPQGPVYLALDAAIQEEPLDGRLIPVPAGAACPSSPGPDPAALERLAATLVEAERPMMITGYPGRDRRAWGWLVELAELLGIGVVDTNLRLNFPNRHPHNLTGAHALDDADVILLVDVKDIGQHTQLLRKETRGQRLALGEGVKLLDLGFGDLGLPAWTAHFGSWYQPAQQVIADTAVALPLLLERCRALEAAQPERREARARRREQLRKLHERTGASWRSKAEAGWDGSPVSVARLVAEVGGALEGYDWVLTAGTGNDWALRLWDFEQPDRHLGRSLGTATQIGISLGAALAHRGNGKLVVDLQPDGDLMYDVGALWVASHHRIPMLAVMVNNRSYQNDWAHQVRMAHNRGNPVDRASIGLLLDDPAPDFAGLARSLGWYAEGPVTEPDRIGPAVAAAAKVVAERGQPALVDVVCQAEVG